MKKLLISVLLVQLIAVFLFLHFVLSADSVMGKDGIGNLELSQYYNQCAGLSFYVAIFLWISTLLVVSIRKITIDVYSQIAIGIPPLVLIFGWIVLWFL